MEKLTEKSCVEFAEVLASKASVPGGGGASALVGALGVALCSMVGNFTTGKKKYAQYEEDVQRMLKDGETLRTDLLALVEADAAAFAPLAEAYAIPKEDPKHDELLEKATMNALKAPIEMVEKLGACLDLLEEMEVKGSRLLISDVGCGALFAGAAMEAAAMNVFVNTRGLKNRTEAEKIDKHINELLAKYLPMSRTVADKVMGQIR